MSSPDPQQPARRHAHVVTVSDRCAAGMREDASGPAATAALEAAGFRVTGCVVGDGEASVATALAEALASGARLVVTSGGTGVGPRDRTPEGTAGLLDLTIPGIPELLRSASGAPHAWLSRGLAGVSGAALVVNLPGSPRAVTEGLGVLLPLVPHLLDQIDGGDH
ncbi:MogA/MoaB family molybdenum cofactor biosynthesis protein [Propioniciclava soli]|uniref:MogA/MoaB family molybdenum cofactor biosynthesis protein n=1 Tax=Propioniciclava soli TaxID=2775081 RepID=A0ABZ3CAL1_9ACTN